ncbi:MAG TPA: hypothetical protein VMT47_11755 [Polyangia bacterium]|nr:hypothetical protein [Polyangia bacterium]
MNTTTNTETVFAVADKIHAARKRGAKIETLYTILGSAYELGHCSVQEFRRLGAQLDHVRMTADF